MLQLCPKEFENPVRRPKSGLQFLWAMIWSGNPGLWRLVAAWGIGIWVGGFRPGAAWGSLGRSLGRGLAQPGASEVWSLKKLEYSMLGGSETGGLEDLRL